jgi:3-deoxy-D-manno-octulosonic-acid transferase
MLLIYNLLSLLALICYLPFLLFKKGPENRSSFVCERLGISRYSKTDIWIHAVSVGEVIAALPFLNAFKRENPDIKMILSTTTYTGQKIARERFPAADRIMYMPWDTSLCINRAIRHLSPKVFITLETELWPVLFSKLKKSGAYIIVLNGRISPQSFKGYKRIKTFMKKVLSYIDYLYMQEKVDAERIINIGADGKKVGIMGNLKFDIDLEVKEEPVYWVSNFKGRIMLAGSTHKGEEEIILEAYQTVKKDIPDLRLIIAPRHPERFDDVEEILKRKRLNFCRRTQISNHNSHLQETDIILLDTIGELAQLYSRADIALVGGSLLPYGGHNILEPARWGRPILFGPYMDNFPFTREFIDKGAAVMVRSAQEIAATVRDLLRRPEKASEIGLKAKAIIDKNTGAVKKALNLVRGFLGNT